MVYMGTVLRVNPMYIAGCFEIKHVCFASSVFLSFVVSVCHALVVEEKWRTTSSVSCLVEGLVDI